LSLSVNISNLRLIFSVCSFASQDSVVGVEARLHAGRSGVRITKGARDLSSPNCPPRLEAHPAFIQWAPSFLLGGGGLSGRDVILTTRLHLARSLRIGGGVPLLFSHAFMALTGTTLYVPVNFRINSVVNSVCVYHVLECSISRDLSTTTFMYLVLGIKSY